MHLGSSQAAGFLMYLGILLFFKNGGSGNAGVSSVGGYEDGLGSASALIGRSFEGSGRGARTFHHIGARRCTLEN